VQKHREYLSESGRLEEMRRHRARRQLLAVAQRMLLARAVEASGTDRVEELVEAIAAYTLDPHTAAEQLVRHPP